MVFKESIMVPQQPDSEEGTDLEIKQRIVFPKEEIYDVLNMPIEKMDFSDKLSKVILNYGKANGVAINTIGQLLEYSYDELNRNRSIAGKFDKKDLAELNEMVGILNKKYFKGQDELFIGYVLQ